MARTKRPNGTGSVYKRKDGSWVASSVVDGRRVSRYHRTRKEAELALASALVWTDNDFSRTLSKTSTTLAQWIDQWLAASESRLRPKTLHNYRSALNPVVERIGAESLDNLTPACLYAMFAGLRDGGRGQRSLQQTYVVLHTCLKAAMRLDLVLSNPMDKVPKPVWRQRERRYWTVAETQRFIEVASRSSRTWSPLCLLLVATGLRISEALGLTWHDVDLERKRIRVANTQVHVDGRFVSGPPKTKSGERWIFLDHLGVEVLSQAASGGFEDGVFRTREGKPPVPGMIIRELRFLCEEAKIPVLTPHGLRHVHAMLALEATGDPYLVQRRLGHSHISVTLGLYGYSARGDSSVAQALDDLLGPCDVT